MARGWRNGNAGVRRNLPGRRAAGAEIRRGGGMAMKDDQHSTHPNLDRLAAIHAQKIITQFPADKKSSEIDNTVTKALGILQENGVYACFLYLEAKEKENGGIVIKEMLD